MGRLWGDSFDEQQLRRLFREMRPRTRFYKVVMEELKKIGRWKNKPRGKGYAKR